MVLSFFAIFCLVGLLIVFAFTTEEAHAINKIVGYVSEAKEKERQAELAKQNQTAIEAVEEAVESVSGFVEDVVDLVVDVDKYEPPKYSKIIGIQLSRTCITMEKNNVTSNCPTLEELWQFDNTLSDVSGNLTHKDGYWQRDKPFYKDHCNFYEVGFPVMLVVDPDGCWQRERGIKVITIQATSPENLVYKLTADKNIVDELRELSKEQSSSITNRASLDKRVDSLEDQIDNQESKIRDLEDDIDQPRCDRDDTKRVGCNSSLQARNYKFQLRFAVEALVEMKEDLREAQADYLEATGNVTRTREGLDVIALGSSSKVMIDGYTSLGVGRYVDNCHDATVGSNMTLVVDTINYLLSNCNDTNFISIKSTHKEQTPINISEFKEYKFREWLALAKERCKVKC